MALPLSQGWLCGFILSVLIILRHIENWKFSISFGGKGLKHFEDPYVERPSFEKVTHCATFRIMEVHQAFDLGLKGVLVRDEWDITWKQAEKECDERMKEFHHH